MTTPEVAIKVRQNKARRRATRQGFTLEKVRRIDPQAFDYGWFRMLDDRNRVVAQLPDLEAVEKWLDEGQ